MTALLKYDAARRAVAEAKTFDEVRDWEDKAAALQEYSRRARDRSMELDCMEIRERARRRRGEMLADLKNQGALAEGRKKLSDANDSFRVTLQDINVSADESSRDQKLARLDGDSFERLIARCRAYAEAHPEKHTLDVLKPPADVNGHRAVMGSRLEPDDSLDYFPTPPWATRTLIEVVLPKLRIAPDAMRSIWEPACGEGHMAETLSEYAHTEASDIFDYGYGKVADFLDLDDYADWIITNPPFGERATKFIRHALDHADNVAMFLQLRYLEGLDRYETIFKQNPPTQCAFFVERVPLHRGRWEPDGDTATAYCWLIWMKGKNPRPPFWIAPGQRESLTRADDRERFTVHPVKKRNSIAAEVPSSAARPSLDAAGEGLEPACAASAKTRAGSFFSPGCPE